MIHPIHILGGGLAGSEAAYQASRAGLRVILHEMRPVRETPAHKTDRLAELVCSNSLKTEQESSAPWLLKQELRRLDSLLLRIADQTRVPAGHALTVDREVFGERITAAIAAEPNIEIRREEVTAIPGGIVVIATGPLTSDALAAEIARLTGSERLFFYDAISPIVEADSIDLSVAFRASRYGKSLDSTEDYINCPFDKEQYERFVDALLAAENVSAHIPEDVPFFEACLPVEEIARRGRETLRFGPMKPMGLTDPRTGRRPYAVVQLRQENLRADSYNLVGFQNHLRFPEQARVLRMIPDFERRVRPLRPGPPEHLHQRAGASVPDAPAKARSTHLLRRTDFRRRGLCGIDCDRVDRGAERRGSGARRGAIAPAGRNRARVAMPLCFGADPSDYQPANITFDLLPALDEDTQTRLRRDKRARHAEICRRAVEALGGYLAASHKSALSESR